MNFDELPFLQDEDDDLPFEPVDIKEEDSSKGLEKNNLEILEDFEKQNDEYEDFFSNIQNVNETEISEIRENVNINQIRTEEIKQSNINEVPKEYIPTEKIINTETENIVSTESMFEKNEMVNKENFFKDATKKVKSLANALPILAFTFVSILGIYVYSLNARADQINLIKIEENNKVGYINENGEVLAKAKYTSGSDFYKGYAIVKNYNNLSGILNGNAKLEVPFGNFFYVDLYKNRYIVSKFTDQGLKQALLDENIEEITQYKYDNISYSRDGLFLFTRDETLGIMNSAGKEIYTYKVDEVDDRNISIEVSDIANSNEKYKYARIKVNSSSTIINVQTGREVYKYTLDDIHVLDNNVFYVKNKDRNNRYIVIDDDKILYETTNYKRLRIEDINSKIALGIKDDATIDYIDLINRKVINSNENIKYTYSDGVVLSMVHNFSTDKDEYKIFDSKKEYGSFKNIKTVDSTFVNGFAKIYTDDGKYSYINKKGKIITDKKYDEISDFTSYGYAAISNDKEYGVINNNGKEVIKLEYDEIVMFNEDFFNMINKKCKEEIFIVRVNEKYGIVNSKGKMLIKPVYDSFKVITNKYPILKANYNGEEILINLEKIEPLSMKINKDVDIYQNYIVINNKYYNYNGELIYTAK